MPGNDNVMDQRTTDDENMGRMGILLEQGVSGGSVDVNCIYVFT